MNKAPKRDSVYQDLVYLNGYYAKINIDLLPAVSTIFEPTGLEVMLFVDIVTAYESAHQTPPAYSYSDLADKYNKTPCGIRKAIKQLLKQQLIVVEGERMGRAKTLYAPNIEFLHPLVFGYVKGRSV